MQKIESATALLNCTDEACPAVTSSRTADRCLCQAATAPSSIPPSLPQDLAPCLMSQLKLTCRAASTPSAQTLPLQTGAQSTQQPLPDHRLSAQQLHSSAAAHLHLFSLPSVHRCPRHHPGVAPPQAGAHHSGCAGAGSHQLSLVQHHAPKAKLQQLGPAGHVTSRAAQTVPRSPRQAKQHRLRRTSLLNLIVLPIFDVSEVSVGQHFYWQIGN